VRIIIGNASLLDLRPAVLGDLAALEDEPGARPRRGQASDALADGWRVVELAVAPAFARARGVMPRVARPLGPLGVAGAPPRVGLAPLVIRCLRAASVRAFDLRRGKGTDAMSSRLGQGSDARWAHLQDEGLRAPKLHTEGAWAKVSATVGAAIGGGACKRGSRGVAAVAGVPADIADVGGIGGAAAGVLGGGVAAEGGGGVAAEGGGATDGGGGATDGGGGAIEALAAVLLVAAEEAEPAEPVVEPVAEVVAEVVAELTAEVTAAVTAVTAAAAAGSSSMRRANLLGDAFSGSVMPCRLSRLRDVGESACAGS